MGLRGQEPSPDGDPAAVDTPTSNFIRYKNIYDIDTSKTTSVFLGIIDGMQHVQSQVISKCFDSTYYLLDFLDSWKLTFDNLRHDPNLFEVFVYSPIHFATYQVAAFEVCNFSRFFDIGAQLGNIDPGFIMETLVR